jgi:hypothetical protein
MRLIYTLPSGAASRYHARFVTLNKVCGGVLPFNGAFNGIETMRSRESAQVVAMRD